MQLAGGINNHHVVFGVLMSLIKNDLITCGVYLEFEITGEVIQSIYKRMNWSRRMVTACQTTNTKSIWLETQT